MGALMGTPPYWGPRGAPMGISPIGVPQVPTSCGCCMGTPLYWGPRSARVCGCPYGKAPLLGCPGPMGARIGINPIGVPEVPMSGGFPYGNIPYWGLSGSHMGTPSIGVPIWEYPLLGSQRCPGPVSSHMGTPPIEVPGVPIWEHPLLGSQGCRARPAPPSPAPRAWSAPSSSSWALIFLPSRFRLAFITFISVFALAAAEVILIFSGY